MKRRALLQLPFALTLAATVRAADQPWSARLLKGGFDGKNYWAGLAITLAPHWKTYWRVPGDGGIAPQIDLTFENVGTHKIDFPLPTRFEDAAGTTIGYKEEVVFPMSLQPMNNTLPVKANLKSFFGVCEVVCIPAKFEAEVMFDPAVSSAPEQQLISQWQTKVPVPSVEGPIAKATVETSFEKQFILLDLLEPVMDIFVEGNPLHYFGKPDVTASMVRIPVSGAKTADELRGNQLRITINNNGRALEQTVTVR
jgi:DsbC/DsbD-like thiol-disulfide interchange protein